jgi:hypothetical protein
VTPRAVRRLLSLAVVGALATGCGTTVPTSGSAADTVGTDGGLAAPTSTTGLQAPGNGVPGPGTTLPGPPGSGTTNQGDGGALQPGATGPSSVPTHLTTTTGGRLVLPLGVVYLKGLDQAYKAANGGKSATTDSQADYAAVIKDLNARPHARVALHPSYYAVDASSTQSQADQLEAACAHFTSDVHVAVVVSYSPGAEGALAKCLQKHGVPLIDGFVGASVGASIQRAVPDLWQPSQLSLDRVGALEASYLVRRHWVDKRWGSAARCAGISSPRIGVVTFDRPDWRAAYANAVAPTFKTLGHAVYDAEFLAVSGSTAEQLAQASSGAQSAVLKFSSECIDHVAFVGNVALDYLFMNVAQQQGYNPRYGLSSLEAPPVIVQNLAQPTPQLHGAIGPGWSPYSDVNIAQLDAMSKAPTAHCLATLKRAGHAPTDNNSTILAVPSCEGPTFAVAVVERWLAGGKAGSLLDVVNAMGGAYQPAGTFSAHLDASRHDGAGAFRGFAFADGCTCFRYTTGLQRI